MYILVPYQLTGIQKGIQSLHAVVEYANQYASSPAYQRWSQQDKTVIVLNGGTTHNTNGTINAAFTQIVANNVPVAAFYEPDLNDTLTAVAFLVDERVFQKDLYMSETITDEFTTDEQLLGDLGSYQNVFLRRFVKNFRLA